MEILTVLKWSGMFGAYLHLKQTLCYWYSLALTSVELPIGAGHDSDGYIIVMPDNVTG
jgi:hypothetical protein